jgi:hypothetical protein
LKRCTGKTTRIEQRKNHDPGDLVTFIFLYSLRKMIGIKTNPGIKIGDKENPSPNVPLITGLSINQNLHGEYPFPTNSLASSTKPLR